MDAVDAQVCVVNSLQSHNWLITRGTNAQPARVHRYTAQLLNVWLQYDTNSTDERHHQQPQNVHQLSSAYIKYTRIWLSFRSFGRWYIEDEYRAAVDIFVKRDAVTKVLGLRHRLG